MRVKRTARANVSREIFEAEQRRDGFDKIHAGTKGKAAFWWCYMDLEARASPKEILKEMPTDVLIAEFYRAAAEASEKDEAVGRGL